MTDLRNIIFLVALIAAAVGGYLVGARSGHDAKDALAKLEGAGKEGTVALEKANAELRTQLAAQSAQYEQEKKRLNDDLSARRDKLAAQLAARDKTISDLKARSVGDQAEIRQLKAHLNDTLTASERQATLERIAKLESDKASSLLEARGESCLKIPVPKGVLATLGEGKQ